MLVSGESVGEKFYSDYCRNISAIFSQQAVGKELGHFCRSCKTLYNNWRKNSVLEGIWETWGPISSVDQGKPVIGEVMPE